MQSAEKLNRKIWFQLEIVEYFLVNKKTKNLLICIQKLKEKPTHIYKYMILIIIYCHHY